MRHFTSAVCRVSSEDESSFARVVFVDDATGDPPWVRVKSQACPMVLFLTQKSARTPPLRSFTLTA